MPASLESPPASPRTESQSTCFVCGPTHPGGLRIRYERASDGSVFAVWAPDSRWEGFPGIIHGGIVSTVLDEAMSKAVAALPCQALTAALRVRLHRRVQSGMKLRIRGWVLERRKRRVRTEAVLEGLTGQEYAHAWGTFLELNQQQENLSEDCRTDE
jgi:acyl-coenzyme A thioesterase PaaI-like protein